MNIRTDFYLKWITNLAKIYIYLSEAKKKQLLAMVEQLNKAENQIAFEEAASGIYNFASRWKTTARWNPKTIKKEMIKLLMKISSLKIETGEVLKWSVETEYKGIKMRSKLEAKWAEFFDEKGIFWEYEPAYYEHDGLKYLPDFSLPDKKIIFEVKGVMDSRDELKKQMMAEICKEIGWRYVIGFSEIPKAYLIDPDGSQTEYLEWMEG